MIDTYRMPVTSCPHCGAQMDAVSEANGKGRQPRPGDFVLCFFCAQVLVFNDELRQVRVPPLVKIPPVVLQAQRELQQFHQLKGQ